MKRKLLCILFALVLTGAVPFVLMLLPRRGGKPGASASPSPSPAPPAGLAAQSIPVWDVGAGELRTLTPREYLVGVAAAELPADWPDAALQAQMVAAHSWALYQKDTADPQKQGAYFEVDPALRQGYLTLAARQSLWGKAAPANEARLQTLAAGVEGALLTWEGAPALACWHSSCAGHTRDSGTVWQQSLPYLRGVDSPTDQNAPDWEVIAEYSARQVADAVSGSLGIALTDSPADWFTQKSTDAAGYVLTLRVGGQLVSGTALRDALHLRSACFEIACTEEDRFTITTRGYGHGVGLSQYGAFFMAQKGSDWREILAFYFPGTAVSG